MGIPIKHKKDVHISPGTTRGIHASHVMLFPPGFHTLVCSQRNLQDLGGNTNKTKDAFLSRGAARGIFLSHVFGWMWMEMQLTKTSFAERLSECRFAIFGLKVDER